MFDHLSELPPAVPLLLSEIFRADAMSDGSLLPRMRKLMPELKRQSAWYLSQPRDSVTPAPVGQLNTYLDGGLNLFDAEASCRRLDCRIDSALRVSRSVALLADTVWLTDLLSHRFAHSSRWSDMDLLRVVDDALVLSVISPLISEGIVRFTPAIIPLCPACNIQLQSEVDEITDHLMQLFEKEFDMHCTAEGIHSLDTGTLFSPPMHLYNNKPRQEPAPDRVVMSAWDVVREAARKAVWVSFQASTAGGSVFSNSKAAMAALAYREGAARNPGQFRMFEENRNISVPWVSELSPQQIVQLRSEASKALPAFRETLATALETPEGSVSEMKSTVADLRAQAVEVRGELENTKKHAARFWKTGYMTLGFTISAYGVGTGQIMPALGGLLPLLQLMVSHTTGTEKDVDKLQRRPGYVLVKAQDILAHRH